MKNLRVLYLSVLLIACQSPQPTAPVDHSAELKALSDQLAAQATILEAQTQALASQQAQLEKIAEEQAQLNLNANIAVIERLSKTRRHRRVEAHGTTSRTSTSAGILGHLSPKGRMLKFGCGVGKVVRAIKFGASRDGLALECISLRDMVDKPGDPKIYEVGAVDGPGAWSRCPADAPIATGLDLNLTQENLLGLRLQCGKPAKDSDDAPKSKRVSVEPTTLTSPWAGQSSAQVKHTACGPELGLHAIHWLIDETSITGAHVWCGSSLRRRPPRPDGSGLSRSRSGKSRGLFGPAPPADDAATDAGDVEATMGYLSIEARPAGRVYIDGHRIADTTPLKRHPLKPGSHVVRVYYPELKSFSESRRALIKPGRSVQLFFMHPDRKP